MDRIGRLAAVGAMVILALLLVACSGTLVDPQTPPDGSSRGFRDGYVDGCATGFEDAGREGAQQAGRQDAARYGQEADYRAGFDAGSRACYEEERRTPKMLDIM